MPKIADLVVTIPYTTPEGELKTRYQKVGALIQLENNDISKGPGYVIALDRHFNPAGVPPGEKGDGTSILISAYWPEDKHGNKVRPQGKGGPVPNRKSFPGDAEEDPFATQQRP